jgi:hypothetical protein
VVATSSTDGTRRSQSARCIRAMVEQLAIRDPHIAVPAIMALQQAGSAVIPSLLKGLKHAQTRVRRNCVDILIGKGFVRFIVLAS